MVAAKKKIPRVGPRGGVTTISASTGLMKKAMFMHYDHWESLRRIAYEENRPTSEIVREALLAYFEARNAAKRKPKSTPPPPAPPADPESA